MKLFVIVVLQIVLIATPSLAADRVVTDPYGTIMDSTGYTVSVYAVNVGPEPTFNPENRVLTTLVGLYLANGVMWAPRADGTWVKIEYSRVLSTADLRRVLTHGLTAIRVVTETEEAPEFLDWIPTDNILGVLRFDSGSLRIYLRDQSEEAARRLAETIISRRER